MTERLVIIEIECPDDLPPALREALDAFQEIAGPMGQGGARPRRPATERRKRDRARAMAAALRWALDRHTPPAKPFNISDVIAALEQEAKP